MVAFLITSLLFQTQLTRQAEEAKSTQDQLKRLEKAITRAEWRAGEDSRKLSDIIKQRTDSLEHSNELTNPKAIKVLQSNMATLLEQKSDASTAPSPTQRDIERLLLVLLSDTENRKNHR